MKTFVVRLFVAAEPESPTTGLHGLVEEIGNGRRASFASDRELIAFLTEAEGRRDATTQSERSTS